MGTGTGRRPLIGLAGRRKSGRDLVGAEKFVHELPADVYMAEYAIGVHEAGGLPIHIPFDVDVPELVKRLDGLLLPGGTDIDPALYGADPAPDLLKPEPGRDAFECALLDAALDAELPVLGICRGLQFMNVYCGGTLHQHVPEHQRSDVGSKDRVHSVEFSPGSIAGSLYGESISVNSFHHQSVDKLASDLVATGISDDGSIEAVESKTNRWFAVQWHPEMLSTRPTDPAFRWIVDSAIA